MSQRGVAPSVRAGRSGRPSVVRVTPARVWPTTLRVADEAGRADAPGPEPGTRAVDGPVGLAPPLLGLVEEALDGGARTLDEPLHPHPDEADPGALQAQGVVQAAGRLVDLAAHVGGVAQGPAAGDRGEVGEPDPDGDGAPEHPGRPDAGRRPVAELEQLAVDVGRVVDIELERLVRADAALAADRFDA